MREIPKQQGPRFSLFSHPEDRGTFVAYFLGAIVPLIALGVVIERHVLFPLGSAGDSWYSAAFGRQGIMGLFGSIALLSLCCFFMLRRLVTRSMASIEALAHFDSLTGLPNRRLYRDRMSQALAHAERAGDLVAVYFLDLDGFKRINDTLGHSMGDELLRQVAQRLIASVRLGDTVARIGNGNGNATISRVGGDEFTFLVTGLEDARAAGPIAQRVVDALRESFTLDGHEVHATASLGVAMYPADGTDAETLLKNADTAMYCAKDRGRNNYQFYSSHMNELAKRRLVIEQRLRQALPGDELSLYYQPVRESTSGEVVGTEALLRWEDAEEGFIPPSEFIRIAEETGLILEMGEWVLRTACAQARAWQDRGFRPIRMAVNVSGHQLRQAGFVDAVEDALSESRLSPAHLELEITESTIMQNDSATLEAFRELSDLGVCLVLDDFGTGYSSLSYLQILPIGRVKIDRSFVAGLPGNRDNSAITQAIVSMAKSLRLGTVAEGVETLEQAAYLRELGCEDLQGFLFSPAVRPAEFERFLVDEKGEAASGTPV